MGSEAVNVKIRSDIFISIVKGLRRGGEAFGCEGEAEREAITGACSMPSPRCHHNHVIY